MLGLTPVREFSGGGGHEEYFLEENLPYKRFKGSPFQFLALRLRGKIPYYLYLGLMKFSLRRFFIFKKKYWLKCVHAIWRLYWALCLDRIPFHSDLAIVSMIYINTDDVTVAVQKFKKKIRKKKEWKKIGENLPESPIPFREIEPNALKFLRFATNDLVSLCLKEELPGFCFLHSRVFWKQCPGCFRWTEEETSKIWNRTLKEMLNS